MKKFTRVFEPIYLLLLGVGVGAIIACGAFAAPVVFKMGEHLGMSDITQFEGGIIMGKIFMRLNSYLQILLVVIAFYELFSFLFLRKSGAYSVFWLLLGVISIVCIALFVWYYSPFLLDSKNLVNREDFMELHTQSRLISQILIVSLSILFVWRAYKKGNA